MGDEALAVVQVIRPIVWIVNNRFPMPMPRSVAEGSIDCDQLRLVYLNSLNYFFSKGFLVREKLETESKYSNTVEQASVLMKENKRIGQGLSFFWFRIWITY